MGCWLSCGHREDDDEKHYSVQTKSYSRDWSKAVSYQTVCHTCYQEYEKEGSILRSDKEAFEWLHNDKED